jgi:hypothetical protein
VRLTLLVLAACASSPPPPPTVPAVEERQALFDLRSTFWVNLHERLHAESSPRGRPSSDAPAWLAALELYRARFPVRGIEGLLNQEIVDVRRRLQDSAGRPDVDAELAAALLAAAEVYRPAAWREDDGRNRAWIARVAPRLDLLGATLAADHERAYATPWPEAPIRVEVSALAGPVGAFTSLRPTRIAVASADPRYQDDAALEMLFHEAAHGLVGKIEEGLGPSAPPLLWHAVIFFTTGELVARRLPPGYLPYARKTGLYGRAPELAAYERALVKEWVPYLDGKIGLEAALANLVKAL